MAITASALTKGTDAALTSTKTTASVTIHANRLALLVIDTRKPAPPSTVTSVTSTGATWELVHGLTFATNVARLEVWRTMTSADQTGVVTINLSAVPTLAMWALSEFNNVTVTGLHGADAIVQVGDESKTTGNGGLVTLAAFASTDNAGFGAWMTSGIAPNINQGTGFTELHEVNPPAGHAGESTLETEWKINDNSVDANWSGSSASAGIALEMGFATGTNHAQALAATSTFTPLLGKGYGRMFAVDSAFTPAISKAIGKPLAATSTFAQGFSTLTELVPGHTLVTLAGQSVFAPAMVFEKRGIHGNYEGSYSLKTDYRGRTKAG